MQNQKNVRTKNKGNKIKQIIQMQKNKFKSEFRREQKHAEKQNNNHANSISNTLLRDCRTSRKKIPQILFDVILLGGCGLHPDGLHEGDFVGSRLGKEEL